MLCLGVLLFSVIGAVQSNHLGSPELGHEPAPDATNTAANSQVTVRRVSRISAFPDSSFATSSTQGAGFQGGASAGGNETPVDGGTFVVDLPMGRSFSEVNNFLSNSALNVDLPIGMQSSAANTFRGLVMSSELDATVQGGQPPAPVPAPAPPMNIQTLPAADGTNQVQFTETTVIDNTMVPEQPMAVNNQVPVMDAAIQQPPTIDPVPPTDSTFTMVNQRQIFNPNLVSPSGTDLSFAASSRSAVLGQGQTFGNTATATTNSFAFPATTSAAGTAGLINRGRIATQNVDRGTFFEPNRFTGRQSTNFRQTIARGPVTTRQTRLPGQSTSRVSFVSVPASTVRALRNQRTRTFTSGNTAVQDSFPGAPFPPVNTRFTDTQTRPRVRTRPNPASFEGRFSAGVDPNDLRVQPNTNVRSTFTSQPPATTQEFNTAGFPNNQPTGPANTGPGIPTPGFRGPEFTGPGITGPGTGPGFPGPGFPGPGNTGPGIAGPGTGPGFPGPGFPGLGFPRPEFDGPGFPGSGFEGPGFPGPGFPGPMTSGPGFPDTGTPDFQPQFNGFFNQPEFNPTPDIFRPGFPTGPFGLNSPGLFNGPFSIPSLPPLGALNNFPLPVLPPSGGFLQPSFGLGPTLGPSFNFGGPGLGGPGLAGPGFFPGSLGLPFTL